MPRHWIDKRTAHTFALLHRSQEDPLSQDPEAPQRVFVPVDNPNYRKKTTTAGSSSVGGQDRNKVKTIADLEKDINEFKKQGLRDNEGEAVLYGITYDDSSYDYMQHLKPIGQDADAIWLPAKQEKDKPIKGGIEAMFKKEEPIADESARVQGLPADMLPSTTTITRTYQDQQDIPDVIAGFQPDMDPRLREALEALEDEAFIDASEDGDFFSELLKEGKAQSDDESNNEEDEIAQKIAEMELGNYDSDGWASDATDNTIKAVSDSNRHRQTNVDLAIPKAQDEEEGGWEAEFRKFKAKQELDKARSKFNARDEDEQESIAAPSIAKKSTKKSSKKKTKRSGPGSVATDFSMSSSSLFRNEHLTLLDDRFDRVQREYDQDDEGDQDDDEKKTHQVPGPHKFDITSERSDFNSIMDDFLENYQIVGKKMYRK